MVATNAGNEEAKEQQDPERRACRVCGEQTCFFAPGCTTNENALCLLCDNRAGHVGHNNTNVLQWCLACRESRAQYGQSYFPRGGQPLWCESCWAKPMLDHIFSADSAIVPSTSFGNLGFPASPIYESWGRHIYESCGRHIHASRYDTSKTLSRRSSSLLTTATPILKTKKSRLRTEK